MGKKRIFWQGLLVSVLFLLFACGSGGGLVGETDVKPPPTGGNCAFVDGVFTCVKSVNPFYFDKTKWSSINVDIIQNTCNKETTTWQEYFGDHSLEVEFEMYAVSGYKEVPVVVAFVDSYTIDYVVSVDSYDNPIVERYYGYLPQASIRSPEKPTDRTTVKIDGVFFDVLRKRVLLTEIQTGRYSNILPANYMAYIKFNMRTTSGKTFVLSKIVSFSVGNYDYCKINEPTTN